MSCLVPDFSCYNPLAGWGGIFFGVVGLVLGIIGLVLKNLRKLLAAIGTVVSALAVIAAIIMQIIYITAIFAPINSAIDEFNDYTPPPIPSFTSEPFSPTPDPIPSDDTISATYGQQIVYDDKVAMTVSAPAPFTPSSSAIASQDQAASIVVTVTIVNGSSTDLTPFVLSSVTSGGVDGSIIADPGQNIGVLPPTDTIPAGGTLTFQEAWSVADPNDITYMTSPSFSYQQATFTK